MNSQPIDQNVHAVLIWLKMAFPNCFLSESEVKPLKETIRQDMFAYHAALDGPPFSRNEINAALESYMKSEHYYHALQPGAVRIDLDGNSCGLVSAEAANKALEALKSLLKQSSTFNQQEEAELPA